MTPFPSGAHAGKEKMRVTIPPMTQISQERIPGVTAVIPGRKTEMSQTKHSAAGSSALRRLLCGVLVCLAICGMLCVPALAYEETYADTSAVTSAETSADTAVNEPDVEPAETGSLTSDQLSSLASILATAVGDSKAEDKRTPRDRFTAAYLAGNLTDAVAALKSANEAAKKNKVELDYDKLNLTDVKTLIEKMRTKVDLEPASGLLESIKQAAGSILNWLTMIVGGNYVLGMCVFALLIELVMLPLAIKQQKNSIKQASLQPKERAIRKKYAGRDDKATQQKVTTEIQEMYQKEGFSPASGCLPMLIQFPVIIILYRVVIDPIVYMMKLSSGLSTALYTFVNTSEAAGGLGLTVSSSRGTIEIASLIREYGQSFFDKLSNFAYFSNGAEMAGALEKATWPNFGLFGLNTGLVPSITDPSWLLIIPVLTFAVYFASMKLNRKLSYQPATTDQATGCSNTVMDISMPAMSTFICFMVPGALGIYWMVKSIFSTVVRFVLSKAMPLPEFTEEDYKAAEKEILKGKPVAGPRVSSSGKVIRSLHHIDDEDFEDTRDAAIARRERIEAEERREAEEKQQRIENSSMKSEDDRPQLSFKELRQKAKEARQQKTAEKRAAEAAAAEAAAAEAAAETAKAEEKAEDKAETKSEVKSDAKAEDRAEIKSEVKSDAKSEVKSDAKSEVRSDAKAEDRAETKSDAKSEVKPDAKSDDKPADDGETK